MSLFSSSLLLLNCNFSLFLRTNSSIQIIAITITEKKANEKLNLQKKTREKYSMQIDPLKFPIVNRGVQCT